MDNPFIGTWSYRSFLRDPYTETVFPDLIIGAGKLNLSEIGTSLIQVSLGRLAWSLSLRGRFSFGDPTKVRIQGISKISRVTRAYDTSEKRQAV